MIDSTSPEPTSPSGPAALSDGKTETLPPPASIPAAVLLTAGLFLLGLEFQFLMILAPLPLLRLGLRRGPRIQGGAAALSLTLVLGILSALATDPLLVTLAVALFAALIVVPVRLGLRGVLSGWGIGRTLLSVLIAEVSWALVVISYFVQKTILSPSAELFSFFDEGRRQWLALSATSGLSADWIADANRNLSMISEFWSRRYIVGFVVTVALTLAFLFSLVPRLSGRPADPGMATFRFEEFRNPFVMVFAFLIGGVGTAFGGGATRMLSSNLLLAVMFLCFLQGFSVVYAFLSRLPVGRWFRYFVYVLLVCAPIPVAVAGIGLFDEFFDFRRFRP